MPFSDLDAAWEADRFESLRKRLRRIREDARDGGQDYRILMPDSENPHNRLSNWRSWLGQYGRFLAGDPPGPAKDADRIRQYVLENYIERAREKGDPTAEVLVRDVNEALGLNEAWPNICQALARRKFQELARVPPPERIGADQSSATVFRFDLSDPRIDRAALELLRTRFRAHCPDFTSFVDPGTGWAKDEKGLQGGGVRTGARRGWRGWRRRGPWQGRFGVTQDRIEGRPPRTMADRGLDRQGATRAAR